MHIFSSARVSDFLRGHFHPSPTSTQTLNYGPAAGASGRGSTFALGLSDCHCRHFFCTFVDVKNVSGLRFYVCFPKSGHMADTTGHIVFVFLLSKSSHELISFLYLDVLFFYDFFVQIFCIVLTVTPAWIQGNVKGVIGHFAWRKKKITFTYFAFTTAKNN